MSKTRMHLIHGIGWLYIIFLGICHWFSYEQLSFITSGFTGFILFIIGLYLILHNFNDSNK